MQMIVDDTKTGGYNHDYLPKKPIQIESYQRKKRKRSTFETDNVNGSLVNSTLAESELLLNPEKILPNYALDLDKFRDKHGLSIHKKPFQFPPNNKNITNQNTIRHHKKRKRPRFMNNKTNNPEMDTITDNTFITYDTHAQYNINDFTDPSIHENHHHYHYSFPPNNTNIDPYFDNMDNNFDENNFSDDDIPNLDDNITNNSYNNDIFNDNSNTFDNTNINDDDISIADTFYSD